MTKLRDALERIGLGPTFSWRNTVTGPRPARLSELMAACKDPRLEEWSNPARSRAENHDYTEEANGMVTDGTAWYLSCNANDGREGLYKLSFAFDVLARLGPPVDADDVHLGSLCVRNNLIYVPCQQHYGIWVVSTDLQFSSFMPPDLLPDDDLFAWCDIHPANGLLYTCNFSNPTHLRAYEMTGTQVLYRPQFDIPILQPTDGKITTRVQSACFTSHHKWFAVCDVEGAERIHCHTTLNGKFLGRRTLLADTDESIWTHNELEGIWIHPLVTKDGAPVQIHVLELNNEVGSADDIYLWHFAAPDPSAL